MFQAFKSRRNQRITAAIILMLAIALTLTLIFLLKNRNREAPDFISVNLSRADSVIQTMSLDEKIDRLLVAELNPNSFGKLLNRENIPLPAAVFFSSDSALDYKSLFSRKKAIDLPPLLFCRERDHFHPDFMNTPEDYPNKYQILALTDSLLFQQIMDCEIKKARKAGADAWLVDEARYYSSRGKVYSKFREEGVLTGSNLKQKNDCRYLIDSTLKYPPDIIRMGEDSMMTDEDEKKLFCSQWIKKKTEFKGLLMAKFPDKHIAQIIKKSKSDLFYTGSDFFTAREKLKKLIEEKEIRERDIDRRLRRVISALLWKKGKKQKDHLMQPESSASDIYARKKLFHLIKRESMLLLHNRKQTLPFDHPELNLQYFAYGETSESFLNNLRKYARVKEVAFERENLAQKTRSDEKQIITIRGSELKADSLQDLIIQLDTLPGAENKVLLLFRKNYYKGKLPGKISMMQVLEYTPWDEAYTAQALFGGQAISGEIPEADQPAKYQHQRTQKNRLGYALPETMGLDTSKLNRIDSIVKDAIAHRAFPGCQVFLAFKGQVVWNKSYGHHTYYKKNLVTNQDVYDIASVTKAAATTITAMHLVGEGELNLNTEIGKYFEDTSINYTRIKPDTAIKIDTLSLDEIKEMDRKIKKQDTVKLNDTTIVFTDTLIYKVTPENNIFRCRMCDILIHKSGLPPSLPILRFLLYRRDSVLPLPADFAINKDSVLHFDTLMNRKDSLKYLFLKYYNRKYLPDTSERKIAAGMYLRKAYVDTLWMDIKQTRVYSKEAYMYSDLNAVLAQITLDSITDYSQDWYVYKNIYKPMGLKRIRYKPLKHWSRAEIVPTERDHFWRNQILHGYVHDPSAALMGGIAGNAGLFSNAENLGHLFQMLLQNGQYGRRYYLKPKVVKYFRSKQPRSHRGLGFDRVSGGNIAAKDAPPNTFGHTGFTGTCVWADPENEIVFVFLSNRVYPKATNWAINKYKVRQKIHQMFYDAIPEGPVNE